MFSAVPSERSIPPLFFSLLLILSPFPDILFLSPSPASAFASDQAISTNTMGLASPSIADLADLGVPPVRVLMCSLSAVCLAWVIYSYKRLSHIPGPFWWSLSPFPLLRANLIGESHQILNDLSLKYGMCGTRHLVVVSMCLRWPCLSCPLLCLFGWLTRKSKHFPIFTLFSDVAMRL